MLINCNNKGCLKQSNAKLDAKTLEVICEECGKSINNISESMKRVLKSSGQILRHDERKSFMMACGSCVANREVLLDDKGEAVCKVCKNSVPVHAAMKAALLSVGKKLSSLEEVEEPEVPEENKTNEPKAKGKKTKKVK